MNVTESRFKNRQLHIEDYLQMVSAEQKELAMGPALLTKGIAKHCNQLYATDYSEKMVAQARKKDFPESFVVCTKTICRRTKNETEL